MQVGVPKLLLAPSLQFRNPFEIKRSRLFEQVPKMRINLMQQFNAGQIPVFEGGKPGTSIKLQHAGLLELNFHPLPFHYLFETLLVLFVSVLLAEDLHSLPISQMGNYQEYIKGLEATGRGPLREVEPQAIRVHAFGNPFKIDKVNT